MPRASEVLTHLVEVAKEDWHADNPGICESCPRYKEEQTWPESCEQCIFFSADNYNEVAKAFKEFKLMEMLNAETRDN